MWMTAAVAAGGAAGAASRYLFNVMMIRTLGVAFPWATLTVNVAGSFLMGVLVALFADRLTLSPEMRGFLTVGLLGGFTTFSAFSLDTIALYERGEITSAAAYVTASVVLSILGLFCGLGVVRWVFP
jgi:CrcB protein